MPGTSYTYSLLSPSTPRDSLVERTLFITGASKANGCATATATAFAAAVAITRGLVESADLLDVLVKKLREG
jgi:hypothetical protein